MAIQNAMMKRGYGDLTREDKTFIKEILGECDQIALKKIEEKEQV